MRPGAKDKSNPERGTIDQIRSIMDQLQLDRAVLFAPFLHDFKPEKVDYRYCNNWLVDLIKGDPRFVGFITLKPTEPDAPELLTEFADKGLVGIKFHPPVVEAAIDDPCLENFYGTAERLGLPILVHTGVHDWYLEKYQPILLDKVARDFPNLNIIIEHMGGFEFFNEALAVVRNNPNCYAGITGTLTKNEFDSCRLTPSQIKKQLMKSKRQIGPERMIYGTDYPGRDIARIQTDLEIIDSWGLTPSERECILGENLQRILPR